MKAYTTSINELIKTLYKEDIVAYLNRYKEGQLFYQFTIGEDTYEFAIDTVEDAPGDQSTYLLSRDLGNTTFHNGIKASLLSRYIQKKATISELYKL